MMIKLTRTSTVEYEATDQDLAYYEEHNAFNLDQIALRDIKDLEKGDLSFDDIDGDTEHEYKAVLIDDDLVEHPINEDNTERDTELFPEEDEEAEAPVAGDLNAGFVIERDPSNR